MIKRIINFITDIEEVNLKSKNKNKINDTNVLNWIKENFQYLTVLPAILYGMAMIIKNFYSYVYSIKAEEFYGVPRHYFHENILGSVNINILFFVVCIFVIISPLLIKRAMRRKKLSNFEGIIYSLMVSLFVLQILFMSAIRLIDTLKINISNKIFGIISIEKIILISIFIVFIISLYVYFKLFTSEDPNIEEKTEEIKEMKRIIQDKHDLNAITIMFATIIFVLLINIVFLIGSLFDINLENKKAYEVAEVKKIDNLDKNEVMLVVGYYKDKVMLMNIVDEKDNKIIFQKYSYEFEPIENLKMEFVKFENVKSNSN